MKTKQIRLTIDGKAVIVDQGTTILQASRHVGIHIPTVCYMETLSPYGGCRICIVEIVTRKGQMPFLDTSCSYEVREGMIVDTQSPRVIRTRKMLAELLVASAPNVKIAQDIAARMGLTRVRFPMENHQCILCGLCIRMCYEQMDGKALGFSGRGIYRKVQMPFQNRPETCRLCGGCDFVCPGVIVPCEGAKDPGELCARCIRLEELPKCCSQGTFGCFCEKNPL
jgi:bidirectional [NiFe] hydrogenase diaphorase subunit